MEKLLKDFVWAHKDLLDNGLRERYEVEDKQSLTEALNQIHWRSLKIIGGLEWKNNDRIELKKKPHQVR